jgi:hypothetical protein
MSMSWPKYQQVMIAHAKELQGENYAGDDYYLQDCWKEYMRDGCKPEDAVESDMECWEPDSAA